VNPRPANPVPAPDEPVLVLLVNFSAEDQAAICRMLAHPNWQLRERAGCKQALAFLRGEPVPVVVCEREQADGNWRDLLNGLQELPSPPSLVVCSRLADERLWAEVLNLGGCDVLVKPFDSDDVRHVTYMAWQSWKRRSSERMRRARSAAALAERTRHA
jgi:DNA-binding response OmpR family regulator